jgi:hypothetical protein
VTQPDPLEPLEPCGICGEQLYRDPAGGSFHETGFRFCRTATADLPDLRIYESAPCLVRVYQSAEREVTVKLGLGWSLRVEYEEAE